MPREPRKFNASTIACNKVNVTWKEPQDTGGLPVDGYDIFYKADSSSNLLIKNSTTTSTILGNLSPNSVYTMVVRAKNFIGFGSNTSIVMAMTHSRGE